MIEQRVEEGKEVPSHQVGEIEKNKYYFLTHKEGFVWG